MKQEQQQQAQHLFFQTDLSKTEIASRLGISRRTIHYWAHDNHWDQIKKSAAHMPSLLAENCYFIMAKMQADMLSEERKEKPPTYQEVNALYKLMLTINKLKDRSPLNETLEMATHFMEFVDQQSPAAADLIKPFVDSYIASRAKVQTKQFTSAKPNTKEPAPTTEEQDREALLDLEDLKYWAENPASAPVAHDVAEKRNKGVASEQAPRKTHTEVPLVPQNTRLLNRAQRRQLARSKVAA